MTRPESFRICAHVAASVWMFAPRRLSDLTARTLPCAAMVPFPELGRARVRPEVEVWPEVLVWVEVVVWVGEVQAEVRDAADSCMCNRRR